MRARLLAGLCLVSLAGCVEKTPPPAPRPAPAPSREPYRAPVALPPAPAPLPNGSDWRDWPVTPGDWVYRQDARGSIALFGAPGSDALVTLRCDLAARMMYLSRAGGGASAPATVRTSSTTRALTLTPTGGTPPYLAVAITPNDPLLDAMGFSRGHFTIEQAGYPTLVIPAWAEIERVTEDCRR